MNNYLQEGRARLDGNSALTPRRELIEDIIAIASCTDVKKLKVDKLIKDLRDLTYFSTSTSSDGFNGNFALAMVLLLSKLKDSADEKKAARLAQYFLQSVTSEILAGNIETLNSDGSVTPVRNLLPPILASLEENDLMLDFRPRKVASLRVYSRLSHALDQEGRVLKALGAGIAQLAPLGSSRMTNKKKPKEKKDLDGVLASSPGLYSSARHGFSHTEHTLSLLPLLVEGLSLPVADATRHILATLIKLAQEEPEEVYRALQPKLPRCRELFNLEDSVAVIYFVNLCTVLIEVADESSRSTLLDIILGVITGPPSGITKAVSLGAIRQVLTAKKSVLKYGNQENFQMVKKMASVVVQLLKETNHTVGTLQPAVAEAFQALKALGLYLDKQALGDGGPRNDSKVPLVEVTELGSQLYFLAKGMVSSCQEFPALLFSCLDAMIWLLPREVGGNSAMEWQKLVNEVMTVPLSAPLRYKLALSWKERTVLAVHPLMWKGVTDVCWHWFSTTPDEKVGTLMLTLYTTAVLPLESAHQVSKVGLSKSILSSIYKLLDFRPLPGCKAEVRDAIKRTQRRAYSFLAEYGRSLTAAEGDPVSMKPNTSPLYSELLLRLTEVAAYGDWEARRLCALALNNISEPSSQPVMSSSESNPFQGWTISAVLE